MYVVNLVSHWIHLLVPPEYINSETRSESKTHFPSIHHLPLSCVVLLMMNTRFQLFIGDLS